MLEIRLVVPTKIVTTTKKANDFQSVGVHQTTQFLVEQAFIDILSVCEPKKGKPVNKTLGITYLVLQLSIPEPSTNVKQHNTVRKIQLNTDRTSMSTW